MLRVSGAGLTGARAGLAGNLTLRDEQASHKQALRVVPSCLASVLQPLAISGRLRFGVIPPSTWPLVAATFFRSALVPLSNRRGEARRKVRHSTFPAR